jgi:hypothetical protein
LAVAPEKKKETKKIIRRREKKKCSICNLSVEKTQSIPKILVAALVAVLLVKKPYSMKMC